MSVAVCQAGFPAGVKYVVREPRTDLDPTYYQVEGEGQLHQKMDTISAEYQKFYNSWEKLMREEKDIKALTDGKFYQDFVKPLERAEKIHAALIGYRINQDVSV
ncbi:MAG TPA: hypothetical protein VGL94_20875 [Ktedonobacteraceae bacterium]